MYKPWVGLLPAAGHGLRLKPFRYPKELLPVTYELSSHSENELRPRAVMEFALGVLEQADIDKCFVVIAPWKLDIVNYLGDGSDVGVRLTYLYQETARGLPHALDLAHPWTRDCNIAFAMPDTIVRPSNCLRQLRRLFEATGADLALGVFPTMEAERLGPVLLDGNQVLAVYDKCAIPPANNTWGVALWGSAFSELLHSELAHRPPDGCEPVIGHYFDLAVRSGLKTCGQFFPNGSFTDIGTPKGIKMWVNLAAEENLR